MELDIFGPVPEAKRKVMFLLVTVDYFTKWSEVKRLASITERQVMNFVWESIICRYGLLGEIMTDNEK